jgi:nucleotide-binding universal stress UspA family protein
MKIIVPIDFSANSKNALEYASALAQATKSTIKLVHIVRPTTYNAVIVGIMAEEVTEKKAAGIKEIKQILQELNAKYKDVIYDYEIYEGETPAEIIHCATDNNASIIIMGTHGATGFKKIFFGSNTASVIEQSACPVLAIPENYSFKIPKKIVFATNYHSSDLFVIQQLAKIAEVFASEINVLHIIDDDTHSDEKLIEIKQFLANIAPKIPYSKICYKLFNSKDIPKGIESIIEQEDADIITLSTHKRNTIEKLINKSMTKELSFHTKVPLLAFSMKEADNQKHAL